MAQVITFENYRPVARYDSLPWTEARIEEATTATGPWTQIDVISLIPVDPDPTDPAVRNFTTELASDTPNLWYRVVFADLTGDTLQATAAVQNTPTPPTPYATVAELARLLKVNAATYAEQLSEVLTAAAGEIDSELGLFEDDADPLSEDWQLSLAAQVNLERAAEHWHQRQVSFGIIGLDTEGPVRLARDTWDRHAHKLAPLKASWGLA